ncbi:MAG TPA: ABC transporter permease [Gemmataceae bacterium]|nr:ABC transporter permease [Gemmataceae bacterium]
MNREHRSTPTVPTQSVGTRYWPLGQLVLARLREFYREPEAIFWVYGFPILMVVALGIAFRNKPVEFIVVDVQKDGAEEAKVQFVRDALSKNETFKVQVNDSALCRLRLRTGKTALIVVPPSSSGGAYEYLLDPTREESRLAQSKVDDALQRQAGRGDPLPVQTQTLQEPGGRYIDFLVPGLVGMSLMGGGLWGVGFVVVDMRIRKVLKRFLATPMRKGDFMLGILISRLLFLIPEILVILLFAWLAFGVVIQGSLLALTVLILLGALTFAGIGLLVASRARTLEAVSGLMNLVMLPMWVLSGIFFSAERFPEAMQPFIQALPLTPLIDALRAVTLEGTPLPQLWPQTAILSAWAAGSFVLALRWFRWN